MPKGKHHLKAWRCHFDPTDTFDGWFPQEEFERTLASGWWPHNSVWYRRKNRLYYKIVQSAILIPGGKKGVDATVSNLSHYLRRPDIMNRTNAIKYALECMARELQRVAVDANLHDIYKMTTPSARNASRRRRKIIEAMEILESLR